MGAIELLSDFSFALPAYDGGSAGGQMTRVYTVDVGRPTRTVNGIEAPNYMSRYMSALVDRIQEIMFEKLPGSPRR
jgi:hypothetical protein